MRKSLLILSAVALLFVASAFSLHKFYVAIFQVNFASEKKMLQVTSRVFIDDLNDALLKKYKAHTNLGEASQSENDIALLKKYFTENFTIAVNGKLKPIEFISHETDNNVFVCYFRVTGIAKVNELEVTAKILFDHVTEQQNIIQTNINGKKETQLLTVDDAVGEFKY